MSAANTIRSFHLICSLKCSCLRSKPVRMQQVFTITHKSTKQSDYVKVGSLRQSQSSCSVQTCKNDSCRMKCLIESNQEQLCPVSVGRLQCCNVRQSRADNRQHVGGGVKSFFPPNKQNNCRAEWKMIRMALSTP